MKSAKNMSALMKGYKKLRFYHLPAIVLSLIASHQLYQVKHSQLSPWKGGGFGMFSAINSPGMRAVSVDVYFRDCTKVRAYPLSYKKLQSYDRLRSGLSECALNDFCQDLLEFKWYSRIVDKEGYMRAGEVGELASQIDVRVYELTCTNGKVMKHLILSTSEARE